MSKPNPSKYWCIAVTLSLFMISGCGDSNSPPDTTRPSTLLTRNESEYQDMRARIFAINKSCQVFDGWSMSNEHLFVEDPPLRDQIVLFDRAPGNLDLLFHKLSQPATEPDEALAIAQMLVFYAEWQDESDHLVRSTEASRLLALIKNSKDSPIVLADRRYPDASILRIIQEACEKVIQGHQVLL